MNTQELRKLVENYMDADSYFSVLENGERTFRVNRLKISMEKFMEICKIPCQKSKYFDFIFNCDRDVKLGKTLEYFMGYIHTQTFSSMLPPLALDPKPHTSVLDIAAAPGGKTTEMADLMKNTGFIVANDTKTDRMQMLVANIRRLGVLNTAVRRGDGRKLGIKDMFDYALVDSPCSSLGSSLTPARWWTPHRSRDLARVQRKLITAAFDALKGGGTLVYSTCTFIERENEEVVNFLLENREYAAIEKINLDIPHSEGISEYEKEMKKTWRVYPEHVNSESFFIAKIKKMSFSIQS